MSVSESDIYFDARLRTMGALLLRSLLITQRASRCSCDTMFGTALRVVPNVYIGTVCVSNIRLVCIRLWTLHWTCLC